MNILVRIIEFFEYPIFSWSTLPQEHQQLAEVLQILHPYTQALAFYIIALYVNNPYVIYFSYILNGLGYGGAYNVLISLAMQYFDREYRNVSMGIYQAFFALGIYYGDYVYVWIGKHIKNGLLGFTQSKSIFLIVIGITLISMLMVKLKVRDN